MIYVYITGGWFVGHHVLEYIIWHKTKFYIDTGGRVLSGILWAAVMGWVYFG